MSPLYLLALLFPALWLMWRMRRVLTPGVRRGGPRWALCTQDEDIKIASDNPSEDLWRPQDTGESVAAEFRRHKENGNIFAANRLGEELARPLLARTGPLFPEAEEKVRSQMCFLYGLAVRKAVAQGIQVTILADTVLHSFSETVENSDPALYEKLNDAVADTIYRLCLGSRQCLGNAFAKLVDKDGEEGWAQQGDALFLEYLAFTGGKVGKVRFK